MSGAKNVDPRLLARMKAQEGKDSVSLKDRAEGTRITFETRNSVYVIDKVDGNVWLLEGGSRWKIPTRVFIPGCNFGGSVLKIGALEEGMHAEIHEEATRKIVCTSPIINLWEDDIATQQTASA